MKGLGDKVYITKVEKDIMIRNKELYGDDIAKFYLLEEMAELSK